VAVRVPAHPVARALLEAADLPVAAPSANRSTSLSPTQAEHVLVSLDGRIDLVLDGGPTPGGMESTVLDLTASPARLLRPGLVTPAQIEAIVGPIQRPAAGTAVLSPGPLPSPGMLPRHYAPRARLSCVGGYGKEDVEQLRRQGLRVGWVTVGDRPVEDQPGLVAASLPRDPEGYAARLYAVLHDLDAAGVDHIIVELPPEGDEWLAVRDRLRRASS
jgi:L-threonylcarbamoyladenylate synthase